jgi:hypothetical protein
MHWEGPIRPARHRHLEMTAPAQSGVADKIGEVLLLAHRDEPML